MEPAPEMCFCFHWILRGSASPEAAAMASVQSGLQVLRASQREITGTVDHLWRRVQDCDRSMMEIGLRRRQASGRALSNEQKTALTRHLRRKRLCGKRIERFEGLLSTVEQQIACLEDASTLHASVNAMRQGNKAHSEAMQRGGLRPEDVESILERVAEQQEMAQDTAALISAVNDEMTDYTLGPGANEALEAELERLMEDEEFTGQFDKGDVVRATRAFAAEAAPPPPEGERDPLLQLTEAAAREGMEQIAHTL